MASSRDLHPREYSTWNSIQQRCENPNNPAYADYGGRGIKRDKRWNMFKNFYADMGDRPNNTTIDRIDVDGDYTKDNCRWSTKAEQQRNQRVHNNPDVGVRYDHKHTGTNKWTARININNKAIATRFKTKLEAIKWRKEKELELW